MPRTTTRNTNGSGSIRQLCVNGKKYWQARITVGYDPGTGKQIQRSITGKTKAEVAQKMREITVEVDHDDYVAPNKMTVSEWLDIWSENYLSNIKESTAYHYRASIRNHLKPALGAIRLDELKPFHIQKLYNDMMKVKHSSPKTVKNVSSVLHSALKQAQKEGHIRKNPCDACVLPRCEKPEIFPFDETEIRLFLEMIQGHKFENLFIFTLFTGLREGEICGLRWENVNWERGTIIVNRQLQKERRKGGEYQFVSVKNSRKRVIAPAPYVMDILRKQQAEQQRLRDAAGDAWMDLDLVFTNEVGRYLVGTTVYENLKAIVIEMGRPDFTFHDLRHSFAVASITAGDDIKTLQGNLGHATASFTLDVYGHVTEQMRKASSQRMEQYIADIVDPKAS